MSDEFEPLLDTSPLAQGDVFQWEADHQQRPWRSYGVIVTADCDIAWTKSGGRLSYVPALVAEDYLWHFWKDRRLSPAITSATERLKIRTEKVLRKANPAQGPISDAAMNFMVESHGAGLPQAIGLTDNGAIKDYSQSLEEVLSYKALSPEVPDIDVLLKAYAYVSKKTGAANEAALVADFQKAIGSLPGDVFHVTSTLDLDDGGLFFMLRHISQCDETDVATRPDQLRYGGAKVRRIGRLAAPFKYAMTQNLARVFSDIGLPDEYSTRLGASAAKYFGSRGKK